MFEGFIFSVTKSAQRRFNHFKTEQLIIVVYNIVQYFILISLWFLFLLWRQTVKKRFFPIIHKLGYLFFIFFWAEGGVCFLVLNWLYNNFDVTLDKSISVSSNLVCTLSTRFFENRPIKPRANDLTQYLVSTETFYYFTS